MKIKEVLEQTGLTDRAVRLYIANALVSPENQKSYTGRNSYEFSESDVEQLQKIALLRRADFSIEQIKVLQQGGPEAEEMLAEFLTEKREQTERNRKILSALEEYPEDPTVDEVCRRLEEGFREEPLPKEDLRPTRPERIESWVFRIIALAGMGFFGWELVGVYLMYTQNLRFIQFYRDWRHYIGTIYLTVPIILSLILLMCHLRTTRRSPDAKSWRRGWSIFLVVLELSFVVKGFPTGMAGIVFAPPVYSETSDPHDYLILCDEEAHEPELLKLFPAGIPSSGAVPETLWQPPVKYLDTTRYYYFSGDYFDTAFEIYAQWELAPQDIEAECTRVRAAFDGYELKTEQKGSWNLLHISGPTWTHYDYLFFAWNEEKGMVRYVAANTMYELEKSPMFLELDWE